MCLSLTKNTALTTKDIAVKCNYFNRRMSAPVRE